MEKKFPKSDRHTSYDVVLCFSDNANFGQVSLELYHDILPTINIKHTVKSTLFFIMAMSFMKLVPVKKSIKACYLMITNTIAVATTDNAYLHLCGSYK